MIAFTTLLSLRSLTMPNLSLRGVDASTLARIKASARRRKLSVNRVIVETLQQQFRAAGPVNDGLLALAGKWSAAQADEFDAAVAPFGEVEAGLWAAEPAARYGVTSIATAGASKTKAVSKKHVKPDANFEGKKAARK